MKVKGPFTVTSWALGAFAISACDVYLDAPAAPLARRPAPMVIAPAPSRTVAAAPAPPPRKTKVLRLHAAGTSGAPTSNTPGEAPAASASTAPVCLDTGAAPVGDCGAIKSTDPVCAASTLAVQRCAAITANFDPKVAAVAVACIGSLGGSRACDAAALSSCAQSALVQSCPDTTVSPLCQVAASACKSTQGDCAMILSGLNDQGKQAVATCVAHGCESGLSGCVDALSPTPVSSIR